MNARLPPSVLSVRRMISGSPASTSTPCSRTSACTGCSSPSSSSADTAAVSWPARTRPVSARDPSASPSASSRIDLPAPVSPVSTPSPLSNSSSTRSTSTTFWIASCLSMALAVDSLPRGRPLRLLLLLDEQPQRLAVPEGVREVGAEHRRVLACFPGQTEREVAFYEPLEGFGRVAAGLIFVDHFAEMIGRCEPLPRPLVETSDL